MTSRGHRDANALAAFLRQPDRLATASLSDWDRIIPQARQAGLLARIALRLERSIGIDAAPAEVRPHLLSAVTLAEKRQRDVRFEVGRLAELIGSRLDRMLLLKGAAYVMADLPPAAGRIFNDIDILVPRDELPAIEAMLNLAGWKLGDMNAYDEQYYRRWMHQLPPMIHAARQSVVDVHHTIVPLTARISLQPEDLLKAAVEIPGKPKLGVLAPPDMVLHSAVHLFNEGEYARGLRDLDDLSLLLTQFGADGAFWDTLVERAASLDLGRVLFYALRYAADLLDAPVPADILREVSTQRPGIVTLAIMDTLFGRGFRSPHPSCRDRVSGPALWLLYVRAHYLRMPPHLLLPHLLRKAVRPWQPAVAP